jgi:hypothetical protein
LTKAADAAAANMAGNGLLGDRDQEIMASHPVSTVARDNSFHDTSYITLVIDNADYFVRVFTR